METITLEQLIEEGKDIRKTISYINTPSGGGGVHMQLIV